MLTFFAERGIMRGRARDENQSGRRGGLREHGKQANDLAADRASLPRRCAVQEAGEVCEIHKGIQFNKANMAESGTYPVINGGIAPSGFIERFNEDENTITISQGGASAGFVNWQTTKFWAGAHCYVISPMNDTLSNRYLFHFMKNNELSLQKCQYGAGIPALGKASIESLPIPVPPPEVQREVVRILDQFSTLTTSLTAGLPAEIAARQKQYEYYRDKLLSFKRKG